MNAKKPIYVVLLVISLAAAQSAQSQAGLKNPKANERMMPDLIGSPGFVPGSPHNRTSYRRSHTRPGRFGSGCGQSLQVRHCGLSRSGLLHCF
jgi:hypothetical protein